MNLIRIQIIISCLILLSSFVKADIDLLHKPSIESKLVEKSLLIDLVEHKTSILAVGERGHVINWQGVQKWQQEKVPVSVLLTAVTVLSDGTKIAVGHDSAIISSAAGTDEWTKVFDGNELLNLKIALYKSQITSLTALIETSDDEDAKEELGFQLEELSFTLDDTLAEQKDGPNKPLLSIAATSNDLLFATGAYGTLLFSNDKGTSWTLLEDKIQNPDKYHLNSVITTLDNKVYIAGENGLGFVSVDQGNTWEKMDMPYAGSLFGIRAQANTENLIAFGLQGNLMASNDSGKTWSHKRINTSASFLGGTIDAEGRAYVVGHGGLVIDFNVNDIENINIRKHPSGAAFSNVLIRDDVLILVGQYGIITLQLQKEE